MPGSLIGIVANVLICDIMVSEFKFQFFNKKVIHDMCVCMCVYICIYVYTYLYIYIYMYIIYS